MKYYISDLHLFHPAILQKCSRPFATIDDMHRTIFQNWKKKGIGPCDEVYILGDVGMYHEKGIGKFLMALPGKNTLLLGIMISRISIIGTSPALFYGAVPMQK